MLDLEFEDRQRSRRWEQQDGGTVVPFEPLATALANPESGHGDTARDVPIVLELVNAQRNPFLAQVALLYAKTGHPTFGWDTGTIGTRLDAVA